MIDLALVSEARDTDAVVAGYSCPCGCTPSTTYRRGESVATEGCCCGNQFAVGPGAVAAIVPQTGYQLQRDSVTTPWGERVPVAWAIGPSTHDHTHASEAEDHVHDGGDRAVDPVCGMAVEPESARARNLLSRYSDVDYSFCGKGCKLEFDEDPTRYLDPAYTPSM